MAVLTNGSLLLNIASSPHFPNKPNNKFLHIEVSTSLDPSKLQNAKFPQLRFWVFKCPCPAVSRIKCFQQEDSDSVKAERFLVKQEEQDEDVLPSLPAGKAAGTDRSFLPMLIILLGIAVTFTLLSIGFRPPNQGPLFRIQNLAHSSSSSVLAAPAAGFSFTAFGYRFLLPEIAPGWIYFWLLMAAGCGLFISEEALNIWVGITLARMLSLDGSFKSFVASFSQNAPYIVSTILWVYWGVCISDMIPFYLGKLFRQSGASDDVCSKLGIAKEKAESITRVVQRYGNLVGFVERFSLGVRNPTAFLAGAMGIAPEYFFAGVCCGGLATLPIQLAIGFLMRERPLFALATVATVVGMWTVLPYATAALTAFFLYLRHRYSN